MKRWIIALDALAVVAPLSARATLITFTAPLSGASESPPNSSLGTGSTIVTFNTQNHELRVQVEFAGLTGTSTNSHIHCCTASPFTSTIGVATALPSFPGFPSGVTSGTYDHIFDLSLAGSWNPAFITGNGGTVAGAEAAFLAGMESGRAYLNVHSTFVPGGEIRGFLVPEPASIAAFATALAAIAGVRRRRR